jgi:hypothetical protein
LLFQAKANIPDDIRRVYDRLADTAKRGRVAGLLCEYLTVRE